jgi:hypothetical protein
MAGQFGHMGFHPALDAAHTAQPQKHHQRPGTARACGHQPIANRHATTPCCLFARRKGPLPVARFQPGKAGRKTDAATHNNDPDPASRVVQAAKAGNKER